MFFILKPNGQKGSSIMKWFNEDFSDNFKTDLGFSCSYSFKNFELGYSYSTIIVTQSERGYLYNENESGIFLKIKNF